MVEKCAHPEISLACQLWVSVCKYSFEHLMMPSNHVTILDPLVHTRSMFHALPEIEIVKQTIAQDISLLQSTVHCLIDYLEKPFGYNLL